MPTKKELSLIHEAENEYPETRRDDDPGYKSPAAKTKSQTVKETVKEEKIKAGDLVEYIQVGNEKIKVHVLRVKPDGNLILDTKRGPGKKGTLCRNVCVKPQRVAKI